jgi:hypothetical protein
MATPAFHAFFLDGLNAAVQMRASLVMHRKAVRASLTKSRYEAVRLYDHQMDVQDFLRQWAHRLNNRKAETDVGHECPVHHVQVQPFRSTAVDH